MHEETLFMIKPPFVSRVPILHGWAGPTSPKKCPGEQCFFNTVLGHLTMSTREQESLSKYAAPEKKAPQVVWNWFGGMFGLLKVSDSEGQPPTHAFASIAWPLWIASSGARSRRGARGLGIHRRRHPRGVYIYICYKNIKSNTISSTILGPWKLRSSGEQGARDCQGKGLMHPAPDWQKLESVYISRPTSCTYAAGGVVPCHKKARTTGLRWQHGEPTNP